MENALSVVPPQFGIVGVATVGIEYPIGFYQITEGTFTFAQMFAAVEASPIVAPSFVDRLVEEQKQYDYDSGRLWLLNVDGMATFFFLAGRRVLSTYLINRQWIRLEHSIDYFYPWPRGYRFAVWETRGKLPL